MGIPGKTAIRQKYQGAKLMPCQAPGTNIRLEKNRYRSGNNCRQAHPFAMKEHKSL